MKQPKFLKDICVILAAVLAVQAVTISARALENLVAEEPKQSSMERLMAETKAVETTAVVVVETQPEETVPAETETEKTAAAEAVIPEDAIVSAQPDSAAALVEAEEPAETVPEETQPEEPETIDEVPLYFQTDYPDEMYGSGTIATSGCGITSLAMVATYLTDHEYTPDVLADYFGGCASNNIDRLEYAIEEMQLPYEGRLNFHETLAEVKEGGVAIALMDGNSIFTETQHFVVLAGMNEDGTIRILDPYEPNYSHWQLKRALVEGFKPGDISGGFSGGWVFNKEDMPEEPFLYEEEEVDVECRYPDMELTEEEIWMLASMVWVEAQGEPVEGQQAVAEVVLNRLAADNFPDTLKGVIFAEGQFLSASKLSEGEPTQMQFEAIERAIYGPYILPEDVVFFATYPVNKNIWGEIGGHVFCHQW